MLLEVMRETQGPFPFSTGILRFLLIFKTSQASSHFEALNSVCFSRCQKHGRPPVVMRQGPGSFPRVSTGDSDIASSHEMKDNPAIKPLQGNTAFFPVRASQCPFQLRLQSQSPSHIPIVERSILLRCLWKVGIPLESKPGNQISAQDNLGYTELSSRCWAEIGVTLDFGRCSQGITGVA